MRYKIGWGEALLEKSITTMLIINADDFGKNHICTDRILSCFQKRRVTSTSAMMFMEDSERFAELALENDIDIGLHLNFTSKFNGNMKSGNLNEYQQDIAAFLLKSKYFQFVYNPLLKKQFDYLFKAQYEEHLRLFKRVPTHIDGHRHLHLCMNMILPGIIPAGLKVRRNFTFAPGEKDPFNRCYRYVVDKWLKRKYKTTDYFFDIVPIQFQRLRQIIEVAKSSTVEIMVHPERSDEYDYLMGDEYLQIISSIRKISYATL